MFGMTSAISTNMIATIIIVIIIPPVILCVLFPLMDEPIIIAKRTAATIIINPTVDSLIGIILRLPPHQCPNTFP